MDDIVITVENYKGQTYTFTMPQDATIEIVEQLNSFDQWTNYINRVCIDATYPGIEKYIEYYGE